VAPEPTSNAAMISNRIRLLPVKAKALPELVLPDPELLDPEPGAV